MDTSLISAPRITPKELAARMGRAYAPLLLDVRREGKFAASPQRIAGARRCASESVGLLALSLGLSRLHTDDLAMLDAALPLYDALYAWCQSSAAAVRQGTPAEAHNWPPGMAGAAS